MSERGRQENVPCPCCGHLTLRERGGFELCPECDWEDDGQDDKTLMSFAVDLTAS